MLVVDDDPGTLEFARETPEEAGFGVMVTGGTGRILEAERPALMLLDPVMPDGDGIELMTTVSAPALLPVITSVPTIIRTKSTG